MSGMYWNLWWVWMAGAIALAILEVLAPGYVFLGFSLGAFAVSLLLLVVEPALELPALLFLFAVFSLLAWLGLRRFFPKASGQVKIIDKDINED